MSNNYAAVNIELASATVKELASEHDDTFKLICQEGWANQSSGNVEAPTGYFWLVEAPVNDSSWEDFLGRVQSELENYGQTFIAPNFGWYLVVQDNDGIWFVYECINEIEAREAYQILENQYSEWEEN